MSGFFCGWRRKAALLTLILSFVFSIGWIRSTSTMDAMRISCCGFRPVFVSGSQKFRLTFQQHHHPIMIVMRIPRQSIEVIESWGFDDTAFKSELITSHSVTGHMGGICYRNENSNATTGIMLFPYWSFVIPLILLSAFLLLSKPRIAKSRPIGIEDCAEAFE